MCYILCMCVCVGAPDMKTVSDDPFTPGAFLGGSQGGEGMPPLVTCSVRGNTPNFFFGWFLLFLADFAIFN
jgi:hypothetical protein